MILRTAEAENREENNSQKSEAEAEAHTFAEAFSQIDTENYADNEIHQRDEHQKDPPPWPADNLAPNIKIIDWDDAGPTGLAGFREHFPHSDDYQQRDEQPDDRRNWARSFALTAVAVLDLREQRGVMEEEVLRELDE